jgi:hypothetical protein
MVHEAGVNLPHFPGSPQSRRQRRRELRDLDTRRNESAEIAQNAAISDHPW